MNAESVSARPESAAPWFSAHLPELGDYLLLHQGSLVDLQRDVHEQLAILPTPVDALVSVLRAGYWAIESAELDPRLEIGGQRPSRRDAAILFCSLLELSPLRTVAVVGGEPEAIERRSRELRDALEAQPSVLRGRPVDRSEIRAALTPTMALAAEQGPAARIPPGQRVGRWEIVRLHGEGGLGVVYEAREPLGDGPDGKAQFRRAALKVLHDRCLDESSKQRSLEEVRALAACSHPSVVSIVEWGWHGNAEDRLWIAMPFIEARTLADRMAGGPMPRAEAERIFAPLAGAIEHLHQRGIFHDDLKPENILLARIGEDGVESPVIIDFGMARRVGQGVRGGTPYWMAPESATALVPWAERILRAHTGVVEAGGVSQAGTVTIDRSIGVRSRSSDVFALALMVRDAVQPRRGAEWSAAKASCESIIHALEGRASEKIPPLDRELGDVWAVLEPVLRKGQRPEVRTLGSDVVRALRAEGHRREDRIRALWGVSITLLVLMLVTATAASIRAYTSMLAAEGQALQAQQQTAEAAMLAEQLRLDADAARDDAVREAEARRQAEAEAERRALASRASQAALEDALQAADAAGASQQQIQRALQLARARTRELESDFQRVSSELGSARGLVASRTSDVAEARDQAARATTQVAELTQAVAQERAGRGRDVSDLNGQLTMTRADLERARTELDELDGRISRFEEQLAACRTELATRDPMPQPTPQESIVAP